MLITSKNFVFEINQNLKIEEALPILRKGRVFRLDRCGTYIKFIDGILHRSTDGIDYEYADEYGDTLLSFSNEELFGENATMSEVFDE